MVGTDECFNCAAPASEQYTIILPHRTLQAKYLCDECLAGFRADDELEVHDGGVVVRGDDEGDET